METNFFLFPLAFMGFVFTFKMLVDVIGATVMFFHKTNISRQRVRVLEEKVDVITRTLTSNKINVEFPTDLYLGNPRLKD